MSKCNKTTNKSWFGKLYDKFIDVRDEAQRSSEKDINKTIDKAVKAVRKSHTQDCNLG